MDKREAEQTLREINRCHFEANPNPVSEEQLAYYRAERDSLIQRLNNAGYAVLLQHADSFEQCGRYVLGDRMFPVVQEDGIRLLCPTCGKLSSYRISSDYTSEVYRLMDALHKHLDFCQCGRVKSS